MRLLDQLTKGIGSLVFPTFIKRAKSPASAFPFPVFPVDIANILHSSVLFQIYFGILH